MQLSDIIIELIADILVLPVVLIGAWAMLRVPRVVRYQRLARAFVTGLLALLLAKVFSLFYQGERPFVELGIEPKAAYLNNPGFPSDHALLVFTITCIVWASTKNTKVTMMVLVLSILVALGRVLALVHTPADVFGGLACALLATLAMYGRTFFTRKLPASKDF